MEPLSFENQNNMQILYLCQNSRIQVNEEQARVCNDQNQQMMNLRKRADIISQNLDKLYDVFKDELKKTVPKFQDNVIAIETDLASSDVNKKEAEIDTIC